MKKILAVCAALALAVPCLVYAGRNSGGTFVYSAPGGTVATGQTITASWANSTTGEIANALTASLDRYGNGGMMSPLKLPDGTAGSPALTFTSDTDIGFYRITADTFAAATGGAKRQEWNASGSTITGTLTVTGMLTASGGINATITGNSSTATALASNGTNCPAGQVATGVDAYGNAEGCTGSVSGNAATATALAASGTSCPAGQAPLGVDASGNATGCWTPAASSHTHTGSQVTDLSSYFGSARVLRGGVVAEAGGSRVSVTHSGTGVYLLTLPPGVRMTASVNTTGGNTVGVDALVEMTVDNAVYTNWNVKIIDSGGTPRDEAFTITYAKAW